MPSSNAVVDSNQIYFASFKSIKCFLKLFFVLFFDTLSDNGTLGANESFNNTP